jgi:hypothetical protein
VKGGDLGMLAQPPRPPRLLGYRADTAFFCGGPGHLPSCRAVDPEPKSRPFEDGEAGDGLFDRPYLTPYLYRTF